METNTVPAVPATTAIAIAEVALYTAQQHRSGIQTPEDRLWRMRTAFQRTLLLRLYDLERTGRVPATLPLVEIGGFAALDRWHAAQKLSFGRRLSPADLDAIVKRQKRFTKSLVPDLVDSRGNLLKEIRAFEDKRAPKRPVAQRPVYLAPPTMQLGGPA